MQSWRGQALWRPKERQNISGTHIYIKYNIKRLMSAVRQYPRHDCKFNEIFCQNVPARQ